MKELISYTFRKTPVRMTVRDDCPWFVAADVAKALEYSDATHALRYLDADERATLPIKEGRELNIINESGLYSLILRSRKPEAKAFKKFVTSEVLPSIRRTGTYSVADKPVTVSEHTRALPSGKKEIVLSEKAKQEIGGIVKAVIQANDRPTASVQDDSILKAINLLSARIDNMARFMSAGNTSAAQRECINLAERAAQRASDETGRAYSIPMNKEEYDLICFVRRGAYRNAALLPI